MNDDRIAEIRARHEVDAKIATVLNPELPSTWTLAGWRAHDDRATLLAEVERQARHIEELREKIDAERSCARSFDAPGDVCAAHSPALTRARAEVERLLLWSEVLASHQGSPGREWHSAGAWLYSGDSINVVRAPLPEIEVAP